MIPILSGLGAALQAGGEFGIDEQRRRKAMAAAQAQFEAQQGLQQSQLTETQRHNTALEALNRATLDFNQQNAAELRDRQDLDSFINSAETAGVSYLNPRAARSSTIPVQPSIQLGADQMPDISPAVNALKQASNTSWQKNIDPTAQRMRTQNLSAGYIPGSEGIGGAVLKNQAFSPYAQFGATTRAGTDADNIEAQDFRAAKDDIQKAFYDTYARILGSRGPIEALLPDQLSALRAMAAEEAEKARKSSANSWAIRLQSQYPNSATKYSVEMLLGQNTVAPRSNGAPTGGGLFGESGGPQPTSSANPGRSTTQRPPNTPLPPLFADPLQFEE